MQYPLLVPYTIHFFLLHFSICNDVGVCFFVATIKQTTMLWKTSFVVYMCWRSRALWGLTFCFSATVHFDGALWRQSGNLSQTLRTCEITTKSLLSAFKRGLAFLMRCGTVFWMRSIRVDWMYCDAVHAMELYAV